MQRDQDDLRVMIRFPESQRRSIGDLEDMYIRTPLGIEVPFYSVARFELARGFSEIRRLDGRRVVEVSADLDRAVNTPEAVMTAIRGQMIPAMQSKYPGLEFEAGGEQEERNTAYGSLGVGLLISLFGIYGLLAIPLKSYLQPLVVMSVVPFGAIGAITGHYALLSLIHI